MTLGVFSNLNDSMMLFKQVYVTGLISFVSLISVGTCEPEILTIPLNICGFRRLRRETACYSVICQML